MPATVTREDVLAFIRQHSLAVECSVSPEGLPQAAAVGFVVTDAFEIVFDTLSSTRKARNLGIQPSVALVIGGIHPGEERTVQYEGITDIPEGAELESLVQQYLGAAPRRSLPNSLFREVVMIRKLAAGGYRLYSRKKDPKTGKRKNLGTFKTRAAAEKHERAVQYFKRRG